MTTNVLTSIKTVGNSYDQNQWLAGGDFRDATYPGGHLFGIEKEPQVLFKRANSIAKDAMMNNGQFDLLLNKGFTFVKNLSESTVLHLINDFDIRESFVIGYKISINNGADEAVLKSGTYYMDRSINGASGSGLSNLSKSTDYQATTQEVQAVFNSRMNLMTNKIDLAIELSSAIANGKLSINNLSNTVAGAVVGTVQVGFQSAITQEVTSAFGITSVAKATIVGMVVGSLINEAFEVAAGLDNHFGPGGELVGFDDQGRAKYAPAISVSKFLQNKIATIFNIASFGDTFSDFQYSANDVSAAEIQSTNSQQADNPNHANAETGDDSIDFGTGGNYGYGSYSGGEFGGLSDDSSSDDGQAGTDADGNNDGTGDAPGGQ